MGPLQGKEREAQELEQLLALYTSLAQSPRCTVSKLFLGINPHAIIMTMFLDCSCPAYLKHKLLAQVKWAPVWYTPSSNL